jgi:SCY1-like protein 1
VVREQTLKSVLTIITKLSDRTINGELLKYLAKTANDEQPGIRTNTTICLGKIAKNLGVGTRAKVLMAAFTRSLRDPFVHARNAALLALAVSGEYFTDDDVANRIMPVICPLLIDKEKLVRDQAAKTLDIYLQKVKKAASSMPETALPPQSSDPAGGAPRMSTPQPSESSAAAWAGWAISSFTNKVSAAAGEIQTSASANGSGTASPRPAPSPGLEPKKPAMSSASALHRQAVKSPPPSMSRTSSAGATAAADAFWGEDDPNGGDAWGEMGEDSFFDASSETAGADPPPKKDTVASATPFGDDAEPDFAGWLAAQSQKKSGPGKPLPKGLAKSTGPAVSKKPITVAKAAAKPVAAKKLDLKPKAADDDDGWGDGW